METKTFLAVETKVLAAAPPGTVEAIVSVTGNEDRGGDTIQPGAFEGFIAKVKSGQARFPALLWEHGVLHNLGLAALTGKVVDLEELRPGDPRLPAQLQAKGLGGLRIVGQYNLNTQPGREAYEHVKAGDVTEWSFMYEATDEEHLRGGRRNLKVIDPVYECSNVIVGMNPETLTLATKSATALLEATEARAAGESPKAQKWAEMRVEVADILEQVEGHLLDPANAKRQPAFGKPQGCTCGEYVVEGCPNAGHAAEPLAVKLAYLGFATREEFEAKGMPAPTLTGDEAQHAPYVAAAISAINTLIVQEANEANPEFDCISWLANIGNSLLMWAAQENSEYTDPPADPPGDPPAAPAPDGTYYRAAPPGEIKGDEPDELDDVDPSRITNALQPLLAADLTQIAAEVWTIPSTAPNVPAHTDGDRDLPHFARFGARPRI